jgi:uncharacterized protein
MNANPEIDYICPMECRENCGACCIAISISSPIPGMPGGKPAGVRCIHLQDDNKCAIYTYQERPKVCSDFKAEPDFCGSDREEAFKILYSLSAAPQPP